MRAAVKSTCYEGFAPGKICGVLMLDYAAVLVLIATVIAFSWASFSHFDARAPSPGTLFVTFVTPIGTIANFAIWRRLAEPAAQEAVLLALALGLVSALVFWAAQTSAPSRLLGRAFSDHTPETLIDAGPYAYVRNPLYTSYLVYWLAWVALTGGHWVATLLFVVMLATYVGAALTEERRLSAQLGKAYQAYAARTTRFIPWIV